MKSWFIHTILFFLSTISFCQNNDIDSLFEIGKIKYSAENLNIEPLSTLQKAFNTSLDSEDNYRLIEISTSLGDYFYDYGLFEEAIDYYKHVLVADNDTINISDQLMQVYRKIGKSYSSLGKPDSSYIYYGKLIEHVQYPKKLDILRDLVDIYAENNNHRKSLDYNIAIEKLLHLHESSEIELSKIYNNIGYNYHSLKQYNSSVNYFNKALDVYPTIPIEEKSFILRNLGVCHYNLGDFDKSIKYLNHAEELIDDKGQLAELNHLIATVHMANNDYFNALEFLREALMHVDKNENPYLLSEIYAGFSQVHNATHEYDLAFEYFQDFSRLSDSLKFVNQLNQKRIIDNQKYIERTEKENKLLKAQQDFQELKIDQLQVQSRNQQLTTNALRTDSIQSVNELSLARQEGEIIKASERNNKLEIARQKNVILLSNQQLQIARVNEENATIEREKQQKEIEITQQKLSLQERNAQLKDERIANDQKAKEIEISKIRQRNVAIVAAILAGFALFLIWAYRSKRKDNVRISTAYENLSIAQVKLVSAEAKIKGLLKQQVSGAVAEALITNTDSSKVEERFVCVMFIDIRDFTVFCEGRKPAEIIEYQNSVFGFMINIIEKNYGVVNQLMGDGFMATFGAPISKDNDCLNAFTAAKRILEELDAKVLSQEVLPTKVGIGMHAGNVVTGNVGNEDRKQYSITGNTVILAARLEQLNKKYGSSLVYSKEVHDALPRLNREAKKFESVFVKGRTKPIDVVIVL